MPTFQTTTLDRPILDPLKRVRYSTGLVLGVDEFEQEQAFFMERDHLHQRALHGYGTVHGLEVTLRDSATGPEIVVAPGLAIDPHGRNICVPSAQCARLNDWLNRNREQIDGELASPPESLEVYVVLCYRECETDEVPVPGGPCRSDEETRTASRIRDHFELHLALEPPPQVEEMAVRRLGRLLRRIRISADELGASLADLIDALGAPEGDDSPPEDDPLYLHPETAPAILEAFQRAWVTRFRPQFLHADHCGSAAEGDDCVLLATVRFDVEEDEDRLRVVTADDDGVDIDETNRPFLLTTRVLQEWLTAWYQGWDFKSALDTFATLFLLDDQTIRAWIHHPEELAFDPSAITVEVDEDDLGHPTAIGQPIPGVNVFDLELADSPPVELEFASRITVRFDASRIETTGSPPEVLIDLLDGSFRGYIDRKTDELVAYLFVDGGIALMALSDLEDVDAESPNDGDVLAWDAEAGMWVPQALEAGSVTRHADLTGLEEDDHPQYLLADGSRPLGGDLSAGENRIRRLAAAEQNGDAVRFEQAIKQQDAAGGDLSGRYPDPVVRRIQGRPVRDVQPSANDALVWDGSQWAPTRITAGENGFERELTRIVAGNWAHGGFTTLRVMLVQDGQERLVPGIVVVFGKERFDDGGSVFVGEGSLDQGSFRIFVEDEQLGQFPTQWIPVYMRPDDVLPVRVRRMDEQEWLVEAIPHDPPELTETNAALFLIPLNQIERLVNRRMHIQVLGDFVLDETRERVVDARHLFGRLPSGRPDRGLPGGVFESWTTFTIRIRNVNRITREELLEIPGVGPQTADRILARRSEAGGFRSVDDLANVPGVNRRLLDELRFRLRAGE